MKEWSLSDLFICTSLCLTEFWTHRSPSVSILNMNVRKKRKGKEGWKGEAGRNGLVEKKKKLAMTHRDVS